MESFSRKLSQKVRRTSSPGVGFHRIGFGDGAARATNGPVAGRVGSLFIERQRNTVIAKRCVDGTPLMTDVQLQTTGEASGRHYKRHRPRQLRPQNSYCISAQLVRTNLRSSYKFHAPVVNK